MLLKWLGQACCTDDTPRSNIGKIPKDNSPRSQNAVAIEQTIKQQHMAYTTIKRTFKQIQVQIDLIDKDIRDKRNPRGESINKMKKAIARLQDTFLGQQDNLNAIGGWLVSIFEAFSACEDVDKYTEDIQELYDSNDHAE